MTDERSPPSTLRGRLADVFVPAIVEGATAALARRLGNRATIEDALHGRATSLASVEPLLDRAAARFAGARYEHVASISGFDRDASEGRIVGDSFTLPVAVVAERRRLREIELRIYYGSLEGSPRDPATRTSVTAGATGLVGAPLAALEALRAGAVDRALGSFEEGASLVDAAGVVHPKRTGAMAAALARAADAFRMEVIGIADDGRTACVEGMLGERSVMLAFARGESALVSELRLYL